MAKQLVHNHDTSIKTFAKLLNEKIKKIPNINGSPELELCGRDIVSITKSNLAQDIEGLIKKINNDENAADSFLPKIIIAQSNIIQPSVFGRNTKKFQMHDAIKLANKLDESETLMLTGQMFTYETPIQIVILTRSQYASKELALHALNILANNEKINYQLRLYDPNNTTELHAVDDYGHIKIVGIKSATFSESTAQESGIVALGTELTLRENFFMLKENSNIMTQWKVFVEAKEP